MKRAMDAENNILRYIEVLLLPTLLTTGLGYFLSRWIALLSVLDNITVENSGITYGQKRNVIATG